MEPTPELSDHRPHYGQAIWIEKEIFVLCETLNYYSFKTNNVMAKTKNMNCWPVTGELYSLRLSLPFLSDNYFV